MPELTNKQKIFCLEYLKDMNGTRSAIAAGYSKKVAAQQASENLTKPDIQAYLTKQLDKLTNKLELSVEKIVGDVVTIKERCMQEITPKTEKDPDGNWIENGEYTFDAKAALKASELLMRHLGLLNDKLKVSGTISIAQQIIDAHGE